MRRVGIVVWGLVLAVATAALVAPATWYISHRLDQHDFRQQLGVARSQAKAAHEQVAALKAEVVAVDATSTTQRTASAFAVARDDLNLLDAMQHQVQAVASKANASPCLGSVVDQETRERRPADADYLNQRWDDAANGYAVVITHFAFNTARCDGTIKLTIMAGPGLH